MAAWADQLLGDVLLVHDSTGKIVQVPTQTQLTGVVMNERLRDRCSYIGDWRW